MAIREGRWDCTSCDTRGLTPRDGSCPNCGSPRAEDVKFYLPSDARVVTDEAELAAARSGPDWFCEYCSAGNRGSESACSGCGAPKGESKHYGEAAVPRARPVRQPPSSGAAVGAAFGKAGLLGVLGGFGCLAACCLFMILGAIAGSTTDHVVTVTGFEWERTVQIDEHRAVTEEGWALPAGARQLSQEQRVHHHRQVFSHTETRTRQKQVQVGTRTVVVGQRDMGNGYFEDITKEEPVYETRDERYEHRVMKQEPVYETWYRYEVMRWVFARKAEAAGTDQQPAWPETNLEPDQREGTRTETYTVSVRDETGKTYLHKVSQQELQSFSQGQQLLAKINRLGELKSLGSLQLEAD